MPQAPAEQHLELGWAAAWHELGLLVSHHDHHRHSHYLIGHLDAAGFSQSQLRRMALIALGQRGGLRKLNLDPADEALRWQVMALRLAVIKAHAREPIQLDAMKLQRNGTRVSLRLPKGWAPSHPQALYLLQEEAQHWARSTWATLELAA
jgi:exopolyphosphatase/guanosine-5'-triphosphate,3'-diphosphate pyrophosphatase